jgi:N-acetylmuramic acid 6-phosphate etherase
MARKNGLLTGCITCNPESRLAQVSDHPIEIVVGPEFVTGSTRLKSGTAQKMALNMISTTVMIRLGKVKGNKMVDMQLSNEKLVDRGVKMIMSEGGVTRDLATELLDQFGSVRKAIESINQART